MKTTLGIKLVPKELQIPELSFLADEDMLRAYNESITRYGEKARGTLDVFKYKDGVITGSNSFANVELASQNLASPAQLEYAVNLNPDYFRGHYEDIGLVLRTEGDSYNRNDYNARNLYQQLKHRGLTPSPKAPVRISLRGLALEEDKHSGYGLIHRLTDESEVIQLPEFSHENNGRRFLESDERGVPKYLNDKELSELTDEQKSRLRTFYAREDGLGRLFLIGCLGLCSDWFGYLDNSIANGRVAVVSAEGTEKILNGYLTKLQQERDIQIAKIQKNFSKAEDVLKGR
jgi:hypothetical protein